MTDRWVEGDTITGGQPCRNAPLNRARLRLAVVTSPDLGLPVRIYKTYGNDAVRVISENPYRLARDIRGIGFRTADQIAAKVGIEKTALVRIRAGISYALAEAMNEGHCGLPVEDLTALAATLLEVSDDLIRAARIGGRGPPPPWPSPSLRPSPPSQVC
ncbi:MAG: helix-hairpin-helix domain-containing protein, partial [Acetobacteraceae bacterium]